LVWAAVFLIVGAGAVFLQALGPPARVAGPIPTVAPAEVPLAAAWDGKIAPPDPALLEPSRSRPVTMLPRIGADGRLPRLVYRRPASAPTRPRIALLLVGLGLNVNDSRAAIEALPGPVTLAFSAYAASPEALLDVARARGHEIMASLPMEANGYPLNDAGSRSLLTGSSLAINRDNLEWALGRIQGFTGVTGASDGLRGERFAEQTSSFALVQDELVRRGLMYVDPRPGAAAPRMPGRSVDLVVDDPASRAEIEAKLAALERLARERGAALGLAGPLRPVTVERIAAWAKDLDARGFDLVPVSALVTEPVP